MKTAGENTTWLKEKGRQLGFDLIGIAPALTPHSLPHFDNWVEAGHAGEMQYIERRREAYSHPRHVLPNVRSVVMTASCYDPDRSASSAPAQDRVGRIARYARGERDYHDIMKRSLKQLARSVHDVAPGSKTRAVVDTAPLLERDFARRAGLGWFGKNTMLLNKSIGSYFFLGALLTDLELEPDEPHETAHCGTCTRCLEACPTNAFPEPHVLDARRCISYLTIELRDQPIPEEFRSEMQGWIFGCDICQEVCPWNRKAPETTQPEYEPLEKPADALTFLQMTPEDFQRRFRGTPLERTGRHALARNAAIALGNSDDASFAEPLLTALSDESPLVREAAAWAIGQLPVKSNELVQQLEERFAREANEKAASQLKNTLEKLKRE